MRKHSLLACALLVAVMPAICAAQRGAAWRDSAQRLSAVVKALGDSMLQSDSTVTEVSRTGDIVIAASPAQRRNAADAFQQFLRTTTPRFAGALPSPGGFRIVMRTGTRPRALAGADSSGIVVLSGQPDGPGSIQTQRSVSPGDVTAGLIDRYGEMMIASVPALAAWIGNPPALSMNESSRRDQAMYGFVTAMGPTQQRCVSGGLAACSVAMGIHQIGGPEHGGRYSRYMRADLLYYALDTGGTGAWERLRGAADSGVGAMLAAAARMPTDSVVNNWRNGLLALRPATAVVSQRSALVAVIWSMLFLAGALGASKWA